MNLAIRARLKSAVNALLDPELQERLWIRGQRRDASELAFDDAVLLVIDELATPKPEELVGYVLRNQDELAEFQQLSRALEELIATIGKHGRFEEAKQSGHKWQECVKAATKLKQLLDD